MTKKKRDDSFSPKGSVRSGKKSDRVSRSSLGDKQKIKKEFLENKNKIITAIDQPKVDDGEMAVTATSIFLEKPQNTKRVIIPNTDQAESDFIVPSDSNMLALERLLSVLGGVAAITYGMRRRSIRGFLLSLLGGALIYRGLRGYSYLNKLLVEYGISPSQQNEESLVLEGHVLIKRPPQEVYEFIHDPKNLLRLWGVPMQVESLGETRVKWLVQTEGETNIEFTSETVADVKNKLLAWRSFPDASVSHEGSIYLYSKETGGTEMKVMLKYDPPVSLAIRQLFGQNPNARLKDKLTLLQMEIERQE